MAYVKKSDKLKNIDKVEAAEVRETVKKLSKDSVANDLAKLAVTLNNGIADLSAKYQEAVTLHEKLVTANALETNELERLRQIKVSADTLAELEAQIEATREQHLKNEEELRLARQKEQREFDYKLAQDRKREMDAYTDSLNVKQKEWRERENAIAERENEFSRLQNEVSTFAEREKNAKNEGREEMKGILTKHYEAELKVVRNEAATQVQILNSEKASVTQRLNEQVNLNAELKAQVTALQNKLTEVSNNAFAAMSGQNSVAVLSSALNSQTGSPTKKN